MTLEPQIGDIQIGDASEYEDFPCGYVIEEYGIHGWGIPDWVERSQPHLAEVFNTKGAAEAALRAS